jgi:hypothetical protein
MDKVQKPSDSECYTPSSEHFRFYFGLYVTDLVITFNGLSRDAVKKLQQLQKGMNFIFSAGSNVKCNVWFTARNLCVEGNIKMYSLLLVENR